MVCSQCALGVTVEITYLHLGPSRTSNSPLFSSLCASIYTASLLLFFLYLLPLPLLPPSSPPRSFPLSSLFFPLSLLLLPSSPSLFLLPSFSQFILLFCLSLHFTRPFSLPPVFFLHLSATDNSSSVFSISPSLPFLPGTGCTSEI